ncbi:MAG TPA: FHA domain-containing protein [Pyrinomonadaceae bacterium]|nr:FHA domain-containing protein [Pyrinomonadaceae bacterium]
MPEPAATKKSFSPDWLVRGVLTKLGDTFDRLTGRGWKPSSSLATSELIEKLKALLDAEAQDLGDKGIFVPHNISLKMQWDKFSTDSEKSMKALENEMLTAVVDHINDKRYYTRGPIELHVKPDYFTQGVKLFVSFDKSSDDEREAAIHVSAPANNTADLPAAEIDRLKIDGFRARFATNDKPREVLLSFANRKRNSVGRTKENDLDIDDASISKSHASLAVNGEGQLIVADTGSTNGTFVNDVRVPYGKALPVRDRDRVKFGIVEVTFERVPAPVAEVEAPEPIGDKTVTIDGFDFTQRVSAPTEAFQKPEASEDKAEKIAEQPLPTEAAIHLDLEQGGENSARSEGNE